MDWLDDWSSSRPRGQATRDNSVCCCSLPPACLDQRSCWIDPNPSTQASLIPHRPAASHAQSQIREEPAWINNGGRLGRDGRTHAVLIAEGAGGSVPAPGDTRAQRLLQPCRRRPIHYRPSPLSLPPMPPEMPHYLPPSIISLPPSLS